MIGLRAYDGLGCTRGSSAGCPVCTRGDRDGGVGWVGWCCGGREGERGRRAILSWCGALSDFWPNPDKPILCLHFPCVDSRNGVSSSWKLLPCSTSRVHSVQQWWHAWLCRIVSQCKVVPGYVRCDVGSEELLLGQLPSCSPTRLRGTSALLFAVLSRWGLSFVEKTDARV